MLAKKTDLVEILRLQKKAFEAVAAEYGDGNMPPITQTQEQIELDHRNGYIFFKFVEGYATFNNESRGGYDIVHMRKSNKCSSPKL